MACRQDGILQMLHRCLYVGAERSEALARMLRECACARECDRVAYGHAQIFFLFFLILKACRAACRYPCRYPCRWLCRDRNGNTFI